jgi:hypothetical protein
MDGVGGAVVASVARVQRSPFFVVAIGQRHLPLTSSQVPPLRQGCGHLDCTHVGKPVYPTVHLRHWGPE